MAGLLTYFWRKAPSHNSCYSGKRMLSLFGRLQQRVLCGIFTRFPFHLSSENRRQTPNIIAKIKFKMNSYAKKLQIKGISPVNYSHSIFVKIRIEDFLLS